VEKMERPTKEVKLPISGFTIELYTYYLRRDRKLLESIMLEGMKIETKEGKAELTTIDPSYRTKMEDKAILLAVKSIKDSEGKEIEASVEVLDNLPADDFDVLQKALPGQSEQEGKIKKK
jgi:hypothetical protein